VFSFVLGLSSTPFNAHKPSKAKKKVFNTDTTYSLSQKRYVAFAVIMLSKVCASV